MFIHEKDKLLRKINQLFENSIRDKDVVILGNFIDVDQQPIDIKQESDGSIRLIYIDEGITQLFLNYHSEEERNKIVNGLDSIQEYLEGEGYKVATLYEISTSFEKNDGFFSCCFHR